MACRSMICLFISWNLKWWFILMLCSATAKFSGSESLVCLTYSFAVGLGEDRLWSMLSLSHSQGMQWVLWPALHGCPWQISRCHHFCAGMWMVFILCVAHILLILLDMVQCGSAFCLVTELSTVGWVFWCEVFLKWVCYAFVRMEMCRSM
jgi:hypothetical protein